MKEYKFPPERMQEVYDTLDETGGMLMKDSEFQFWVEKIVNEELDNQLSNVHEEILEAIDKAKLSVLRGMHSGDKVANMLLEEVEAVNLICQGMEFRCHECCGDTHMVSCAEVIEIGHPECPICDKPMSLISAPDDIMRTDAHQEAEAYALRITQIKNSKKDKS